MPPTCSPNLIISLNRRLYDMTDIIEVDIDAFSDSNYGTNSQYSTDSLSSSIYEYRYENGRRYHAFKDGVYALPNDEAEQDRLDIVHHIGLLLLDNKLHLAPIDKDPHRILDIGTGTGIWVIDAAECYPSAQVIGTDLSPIQPSWVPPNVQFQIDDAESEWTWPPGHFDFIYIRHLSGAIKNWPALVEKAYKHVKPGGWVELNEFDPWLHSDDGTLKKDMHMMRFYSFVHKAAAITGRLFPTPEESRQFLEDAGFENIQGRTVKLPLGTWPADKAQKDLGAYFLLVCQTGFEAFGLALLTRELGMSVEDFKEIVDGAKKETKNRSIHAYAMQHIHYGQKPKAK